MRWERLFTETAHVLEGNDDICCANSTIFYLNYRRLFYRDTKNLILRRCLKNKKRVRVFFAIAYKYFKLTTDGKSVDKTANYLFNK